MRRKLAWSCAITAAAIFGGQSAYGQYSSDPYSGSPFTTNREVGSPYPGTQYPETGNSTGSYSESTFYSTNQYPRASVPSRPYAPGEYQTPALTGPVGTSYSQGDPLYGVGPSSPRSATLPSYAYDGPRVPTAPAHWNSIQHVQDAPRYLPDTSAPAMPYQQDVAPPAQHSLHAGPAIQQSPSQQYDSWINGHGTCAPVMDVKTPGACGVGCGCTWFGGVGGLIMTRDDSDNLWLSYDTADIRERVLTSRDAQFNYSGSAAARLGRYFNCGRNAIEAVYWGIYPGVSEANAYATDVVTDLDSILHLDNVFVNVGGVPTAVNTLFFQAERHRIQRDYTIHNIELNLLGNCFVNPCKCNCNGLRLGWVAGVRYFRFTEGFLYSAEQNDAVFGNDQDEAHYQIDTQNNLLGFQIGGQANYCVANCWSVFADAKVGLYGNHISSRQNIYGASAGAYVNDPVSPYNGQDVYANVSKDDVAFLAELGVGATYRINNCWSLSGGYRAVAVSGVALTTNQVPVDFIAALDSLRQVNSNGCLVLHGAFLNLNYCF